MLGGGSKWADEGEGGVAGWGEERVGGLGGNGWIGGRLVVKGKSG